MSSGKFERPCNGQTGSPMATHCIDWDMDSDGQGATSGSSKMGYQGHGGEMMGLKTESHPVVGIQLVIIERLTLISPTEERLDSSWQSSGAVAPCFADAASPAPNSAQPLD